MEFCASALFIPGGAYALALVCTSITFAEAKFVISENCTACLCHHLKPPHIAKPLHLWRFELVCTHTHVHTSTQTRKSYIQWSEDVMKADPISSSIPRGPLGFCFIHNCALPLRLA